MFAQVYSYQFGPSQTEANAQFVKQVILPDLQSTPGFKGGHMLVNRQTGQALGISYWENEADARAAADRAANPSQPPAGVQPPAISNISVATYEVLIDLPAA